MDASPSRLFLLTSHLFIVSLSTLSLIPSTFTDYSHERFGSMDLFEVDSSQHEVEIIPHPVREHNRQDDQTNYLVMVAKHGQQYRCLLPNSHLDWNSLSSDDSNRERTTTSIPNLVQPLADKCLVTNEGWWSYKYCHGIGISQFHFEGGQVLGDIVYLGYYDSETVWTEDSLKQAMEVRIKNKRFDSNVMKLPSHDVYYNNGTICDLTGKPRSANVKLTCSPYHTSSEIITVVEENTCNYSVLVHTPFLCDHPLFIPENKFGHFVIQCSPILSEDKYKLYMKSISSKVKASPSLPNKEVIPKTNNNEVTKWDRSAMPLMSLLETLANSLAKEIAIEYNKEGSINDNDEEQTGKADLDAFIENIVTDSFNEVFEFNNKQDENSGDANSELHSQNYFPGNDASSSQSITDKGGADSDTSSKRASADGKNTIDDDSPVSDGPHDFNSVLVSMLQEILNDGFLQYSENTGANKNDHKIESKRKTLEERYRSTWEPVMDEESDPATSSSTQHEDQ